MIRSMTGEVASRGPASTRSHFATRGRLGRLARAAALGVTLTTLAGCGLFRGAEEKTLVLDLPVSRSEAVRRTLTAFREQGYVIRSSLTSGLNPETEPFRQGDARAVFRASITGSQNGSRIVLSGTYHKEQFGGIARGGEKEVRNGDDPVERALWSRLDQIRLTIRQR
jgi:hypothetical protein